MFVATFPVLAYRNTAHPFSDRAPEPVGDAIVVGCLHAGTADRPAGLFASPYSVPRGAFHCVHAQVAQVIGIKLFSPFPPRESLFRHRFDAPESAEHQVHEQTTPLRAIESVLLCCLQVEQKKPGEYDEFLHFGLTEGTPVLHTPSGFFAGVRLAVLALWSLGWI